MSIRPESEDIARLTVTFERPNSSRFVRSVARTHAAYGFCETAQVTSPHET